MRAKTEYGVEMVLRFLSTYEGVEIKTDGRASIKLDVTKQRLWHRRVLEDIKRLEQWNVRRNSAGSVAGALPGCARTHESESRSRHTVVSMDVAAFSVDGGALPVRSENETDSV